MSSRATTKVLNHATKVPIAQSDAYTIPFPERLRSYPYSVSACSQVPPENLGKKHYLPSLICVPPSLRKTQAFANLCLQLTCVFFDMFRYLTSFWTQRRQHSRYPFQVGIYASALHPVFDIRITRIIRIV